jgi:MFS family permease
MGGEEAQMEEARSNPGIYYGWWIVLAASFTLMIAGGIGGYSFPVFFKPLEEAFGWSRAALSGPVAVATLSAGIWLPIIGRLIDRYGPRTVMVPGALLMGLCNLLLGQMHALWHLYGIFLLIAPAIVALTALPAQTLVSHWFIKKRGIAMGLTMMGYGLGGVVMAKLSYLLIVGFGWRTAYSILAVTIWVLVTPVVLLVVRHKPADKGLLPDGETAGNACCSATPDPVAESPHESGLEVGAALKTVAFWTLALIFLVTSFGGGSIILHMVAFSTDVGISAEAATTALSLLAGVSILGRLGFGALGDRLDKRTVMALCFFLHSVAIALLLKMKSAGLLYLFAAIYGLSMGGNVVVTPLLIGECFGVVSFAAIAGMLGIPLTLGGAAGPVLAGRIFDVTKSYGLAFAIALVAYLLATVAVYFARPPRQPPR